MREFRSADDLTQADVADMISDAGIPMHQQTIAKIETGTRSVSLDEATVIASAFGRPLNAFLKSKPSRSEVRDQVKALRADLARLEPDFAEAESALEAAELRRNRLRSQIAARRHRIASLLAEAD